ncbi:MAG: hypothetical protein KAV87_42150 [Desulfobacteraceae bacterium]|nr:hypothetical protein [Desulfobacteraceae bacterium]
MSDGCCRTRGKQAILPEKGLAFTFTKYINDRWMPNDHHEIAEARRSLLRMTPDYTMEFIWIMSKYNACRREDIDELVPAPLPSDRWFSII